MSFNIDLGYQSLVGQREKNEDFVGALIPKGIDFKKRGLIAAVADGVSTGKGGCTAAQTTVRSLLEDYLSTPENWDTSVAIDRILSAQNSWLYHHNKINTAQQMLTTLTAVILKGQYYTICHIGDSRAYLLRKSTLQQITVDHSYSHPDMQSGLTRAVGLDERILADYFHGELEENDIFIFLTDGVHKFFQPKELTQLLHENNNDSAQKISEHLCQSALKKGSNDNITALVIKVKEIPTSEFQDYLFRRQNLLPLDKLKIGQSIDQFTVTSVVANNGTNIIYQVRDNENKNLFALKTLHPNCAKNDDERLTLIHEQWLSNRLNEQFFIKTHLVDKKIQEHLYIIYDWHHGQTLEQLIQSNYTYSIDDFIKIAKDLTKIIAVLHRKKIIHRDIKPSNFHRDEDNTIRLFDMGTALLESELKNAPPFKAGTPSFINPEQWKNEAPDIQSDLYALAVTLYQILTFKLPYGEIEPYQTMPYKKDPTPPTKYRPDLPIWIQNLLLKGVSRNKKDRFETAEELLIALENGSSRTISAVPNMPLIEKDPNFVFKITLFISLLFNALLLYWLIYLPR